MVVVPVGNGLFSNWPSLLLIVMITPEQLSSASAAPSASSTNAEQELVVAVTSGGAVIVGAVVSPAFVTVTVCRQDTVRPIESVAVQVTMVVPAGYGSPSA
jgi:hypothetical protein